MRTFFLEYLLITIKNTFFNENELRHFRIFYLEYLLITTTFLHILSRISAHYYDIFAYFTSNICSLLRHFCKFYLEYLLITTTFLHILPRIFAHLGNKILNSRNSELRLQAYSSNPVENVNVTRAAISIYNRR